MKIINVRISGVPYSRHKHRGKVQAIKEWTQEIIDQSKNLSKIKEACIMKVTFLLPEDKFPPNFPFGPDLDNLLKRFCDALGETIFSEAPGKDSCIISLNVSKAKVESDNQSGVLLEILPINVVKKRVRP